MPRLLVLLLLLLLPLSAHAGEFAPGGTSATLARSFALPTLGQGTPLARSRSETRWTLDLTNEYVTEGNCAVECVLLDGETARLRFAHRRGLGGGWDAGLELAWLDRGGGFLDGWIRDWHEAFDLPSGERELTQDDRYRFRYERNGTVLLDETRGGSGFGDAQLTLGRRWSRNTSVRAMAKLPLGDEDSMEGGTAGAALWLERNVADLPSGWRGYVAAGGAWSERGAALAAMQNREVAFAGAGLLAPLTPNVGLTFQLQFHGRLYDGSDLTPLRRPGMPLTIGLRVRTSARSGFELGFQEDPSVNGSPDFAAFVSYRAR
jgi:hypothetical protein